MSAEMDSRVALVRLRMFVAVSLSMLVAQAQNPQQELMQAFDISCRLYVSDSSGISCEEAYNHFLSSFKGIALQLPPTNQFDYQGYYQAYFVYMKFSRPLGKSVLFWSRTQPLEKALVSAGANVASSSSIDAAKVINGMGISKWCSDMAGEVFIGEMCSSSKDTASYVYWAEFSERLAEYAEGTAFFLTNGTYVDTSFFGMFELPVILLPESACTQLVVINVVPPDSTDYLCGTSSGLVALQDSVSTSIGYKCFDVFGDPQSPSDDLVNCTEQIISGIQSGMADDSIACVSFATRSSGYATALITISVMVATVFVFC